MSIPVFEERADGRHRRATEFEVPTPVARRPKTGGAADVEITGTVSGEGAFSLKHGPTIIEVDATGRPRRAYTPAEVRAALGL